MLSIIPTPCPNSGFLDLRTQSQSWPALQGLPYSAPPIFSHSAQVWGGESEVSRATQADGQVRPRVAKRLYPFFSSAGRTGVLGGKSPSWKGRRGQVDLSPDPCLGPSPQGTFYILMIFF